MGSSASQPWQVLDWSPERNYSREHRISEWNELEPKNAEYYDGQRFFTVSRNLYPDYSRGWIYGYDQDPDYWHRVLTADEDGNYEDI